MMTVKEAMQRMSLAGVQLRRSFPGSNEWQVTLREWSRDMCDKAAYFTDDLEDAVLTGLSMRRQATA